MVKYVRENAQSVILGNAAQEGLFINDSYVAKHRCKSMLCMPIQHKGQLNGILYMENNLTHNAFTENRLELLHLFLSQAAIALENARLFELATIDGMTKLFVHRYFQLLLDQEIGRALRYHRTFSLILTDIDDFKQFNDTYGHQLGDEVLKTVAFVIRKELRAQDIAARYGGEEFAIVLPETDMNNAFIVAEKLRNRIANTEILHEGQQLRVTISLGVVSFPIHAPDKQTLIRIADNGLYAAKRNGKNQTQIGITLNSNIDLNTVK
jgi:diguanylate cyclase (GGDEF)-like protein